MSFIVRFLLTRTYNLFYGALKENIFFLHVPKCGGTSINHAIRTRYNTFRSHTNHLVQLDAIASMQAANQINQTDFPYDSSTDYQILKLSEIILLYYMNQKNTKYISGHFSFSEICFNKLSDKYKFLTILRDPVKRFISLYFFNRYKTVDHCKIEDDIETFLQSEFGRSQGYEYVKFIGGPDSSNDYTSRTAIARAKRNLDKFDIVGCLEYLDTFLNQFENKFSIRLRLNHLNKNPKQELFKKSVITDDIEREIRKICEPDLAIYQYAVDKFVKGDGFNDAW